MTEIDYGRPDWRSNAEAANAEAERRVAAILADPTITTLILGDLRAMTKLPHVLRDCAGLEELDLYGEGRDFSQYRKMELPDLSALAGLTALRKLICGDTQVSDLGPIAGLSALQSLDCARTQVSDLGPIAGLSALQSLSCGATQESDLGPIAGLSALQSLNCGFTQVSDLGPIAGLSALQSLNCGSTQVSDLGPIAGLSALQSLNCGDTQVSDLGPIAGLSALQSLDCDHTRVSDLGPIAGLSALQSLDCARTQVSDLSVLLGLPKFVSGDAELLFKGTPLAQADYITRGIAGMDPAECARSMVEHLQLGGERPAPATLARVAAASSVEVSDAGGALTAHDRLGADGVAERQNPEAQTARKEGLIVLVQIVLREAEEAQVGRRMLDRLADYRQALDADPPNFFVLDAPIALMRKDIASAAFTIGLPDGLVDGFRELVRRHDEHARFFKPPSDELAAREAAAPQVRPDAEPKEADELAEDLQAELRRPEAPPQDASIPAVLAAVRSMLDEAQRDEAARHTLLRRSLYALGSILVVFEAASNVTAVTTWMATPQGQWMMTKIQPLIDRLLAFF